MTCGKTLLSLNRTQYAINKRVDDLLTGSDGLSDGMIILPGKLFYLCLSVSSLRKENRSYLTCAFFCFYIFGFFSLSSLYISIPPLP